MVASKVQTLDQLKTAYPGLERSLDVYYGDAERDAAMDSVYSRFVSPGMLAFDIGSHVGDRIGSFLRLGARIVALEPQPDCAAVIRELYGTEGQNVVLEEAACGDTAGVLKLRVNSKNPTVTTASAGFVAAADGAKGWEGQEWDQEIEVPSVTLDQLIVRHGVPDFAKIDVEGFEDKVLAGLTQPLAALSFEFTTIEREVGYRCLERLATLGPYRFDIALGECHKLTFGDGHEIDAGAMAAHIRALPHEANSGDIYAVREA